MRDSGWEQVGPLLGVTAILVTFGGIGLAIVASPSFAFSENALSNLGVAGDPAGTTTTALLFNGGLVVGGLLGIGFAGSLAVVENHPVTRLGAILFGVAMALQAGVGVFPQNDPYHFTVASGFYMLFSGAALVFGAGNLLDGARRRGALSLALGVGNVVVWAIWITQGGLLQPGLAIPETIGALLIALWALAQIRWLHPD